jgi:two-component system, NtrC family, response regulator AtoC
MNGPFVAIVDDDSAFAAYLRTFLSLRGYQTRCYSRGDEMLAAIRQGDPPDVVLLDVMMPGLDGLATLRALKVARPQTQAIMLSGREQASIIVEAVRLGAADYIVKPADPGGLGEIALDLAIRNATGSSLSPPRGGTRSATARGELCCAGATERMRAVVTTIEQVADSDATVLVRGESGVGKELVARAIHERSPRRRRPLVKVNCAALPAELLESELFGHEKGSFTGAVNTRIGTFEQADGGTIMLDEIAEMTAALQAKLLHVLQDGEFSRLGSNTRLVVNVRVIAATNRVLETMMRSGAFREDLYYRLKVIEIVVPPLRERRDEIGPLTDLFIARYSHTYNRPAPRPSDAVRRVFNEYDWPGNIRELENLVKRWVILQDEPSIVRELERPGKARDKGALVSAPTPTPITTHAAGPLPGSPVPASSIESVPPIDVDVAGQAPREPFNMTASHKSLAQVARDAARPAERAAIENTLRQVHWNRHKAAQLLGVSYKTILNKMSKYGIGAQGASGLVSAPEAATDDRLG